MQIDIWTAIEGAAGLVTAIGGLYTAYRHLRAAQHAKKEAERNSILAKAKEEADKIRRELEEKIQKIESEIQNQKETIAKDMGHMKEMYNAEIKALAGKIDELRSDLQDQHSSMVALLTKLVNSR